ncbi:MAG: hypothetical protein LBP83_00610, partial [Dysgonamonadaceae bacterium]|nr:hypothetical protein [Dysgonamonadaceae bacterium]
RIFGRPGVSKKKNAPPHPRGLGASPPPALLFPNDQHDTPSCRPSISEWRHLNLNFRAFALYLLFVLCIKKLKNIFYTLNRKQLKINEIVNF